jgi:hypothetical protein
LWSERRARNFLEVPLRSWYTQVTEVAVLTLGRLTERKRNVRCSRKDETPSYGRSEIRLILRGEKHHFVRSLAGFARSSVLQASIKMKTTE